MTLGTPEDRTHPNLTTLVVGDPSPVYGDVTSLLARDPRVHTVHRARTASEALQLIGAARSGAAPIDALFVVLSIVFPGVIPFTRIVRTVPDPPLLVVLSDVDEALSAFEVGILDYVLVPFHPDRVRLAVERVARHRGPRSAAEKPEAVPGATIPVELGSDIRFVSRDDLLFVEAHGDYARLHLESGHRHLVRVSLRRLELMWEHLGWLRVHRTYLVPLAKITAVEVTAARITIRLGAGPAQVRIPVSRRLFRELRRRLGDDAGPNPESRVDPPRRLVHHTHRQQETP